MMASQAQACSAVQILVPASRSSGASNGSYIDVRAYEGDLVFLCSVGAVTGDTTIKIQDATSSGGAGVADITGATTTTISSANTIEKIIIHSTKHRGWIRAVATGTTGPALNSVTMFAHPKYTA